MHEMSIAQSLVDILREEMVRHNAGNLRSVKLHVGQLSAIVPESLSFCFQVITSGTDMEGAVLNMEVIPLRGTCEDCRQEFEIKEYVFVCPNCSGTRVRTDAGQELSIVEMEVD
jgi:hydrogenase nickel incorporation protein HypA/HybF